MATQVAKRSEWLEERRTGIGGSDSPIILGVSTFKSRSQLWAEKRGLVPEEPETALQAKGHALEDLAVQMYVEKTGHKVRKAKQNLRHPEYEWMLANLDRVVVKAPDLEWADGPGVLEIKCPTAGKYRKVQRVGLTPDYIIQAMHYMAVTGYKWAIVVVFNSDLWEISWFPVQRDEALINLIIRRGLEFWQAVQSGDCPEDRIEAEDLPEVDDGEILNLDESQDWSDAVRRYRQAQEALSEAQYDLNEAKDALLMMVGERKAAMGSGLRVYRIPTKGRKTFDVKRFQGQHPDIDLEPFYKTGKPGLTVRVYDTLNKEGDKA